MKRGARNTAASVRERAGTAPWTGQRIARRGSAYIAVLGAAMVLTIIGLGAVSILRAQRLTVLSEYDAAACRYYAESSVEWAVQLIAADPNWRANRTSGTWYAAQTLNDSTVKLECIDPVDGNLSNRPDDPLTVKATVTRGTARQIVQATLTATSTPMDFLAMAIHTAGYLHIASGKSLKATGAPASTNSTATVDAGATLTGDLQCLLAVNTGTVTGTTTIIASPKALPPSGIVAMYTALGTAISSGGNFQKAVLTPTYSSLGTANTDGVYVLTTNNDITVQAIRLEGTLVISCPGHTVTVDQAVFMHNYRADYPVLIVDGNLILQYDSVGTTFSENSWSTNFNPAGAPYPFPGGATNSTQTDTYPNEIQGLVHCRGTLTLQSTARVRGAIVCESAALSNAVLVNGTNEIVYDPTLFSSPPMGYTKSVTMAISPGSWRQVVTP